MNADSSVGPEQGRGGVNGKGGRKDEGVNYKRMIWVVLGLQILSLKRQ